ncbi:hypothetical protein [Curtobacterium pusillum]|uniref:hypothetical protein n=1 Tax=Curtobacterium pusillum TaxID=69373 RepID=UPI0011A7E46E|nr:hypothetical protein [Curtobacterium pusillum]
MQSEWWYAYSDDELATVARDTDSFLESNPEIRGGFSNSVWLLHGLVQLVPVTETNLFSGNLHPLFEAEADLRASTTQVRFGLYKQALSGLRGVLELGLLSVYWDIDDTAHIDIQDWLQGREDTPGFSAVGRKLLKLPAVQAALERDPDLFERGKSLYREISGFAHSRGYRKSTAGLVLQSNRPLFSADAMLKWVTLRDRVLNLVLIFHLLKYPSGLQVTPLSQKLGMNTPVGGFVEPSVRDRFLAHLGPSMAAILQEISDADERAQSAANYFQNLPDYPVESWREDILKQDKEWIAMMGYDDWRRTHDVRPEMPHESQRDKIRRANYGDRLRVWAESEELLTREDAARKYKASGDEGLNRNS